MQLIKNILIVVYFIVCIVLIILTMLQTKDDQGLSTTITGSSSNNFFEKNKGRTKEGVAKRLTVILGIVFTILTVCLSIIYLV